MSKVEIRERESMRLFKQYYIEQYGYEPVLPSVLNPDGYVTKKKKRASRGRKKIVFSHTSAVCPKCGIEALMTVDHIIPKFLYKVFKMSGESRKENKRNLCKNCNARKAEILDLVDPESKKLLSIFLKEVIEKYKLQL